MCVYSMVHDWYEPRIPKVQPWVPVVPWHVPPQTEPAPRTDFDELARLVREWKEASEAAQKVDRLTEQPDCVDPEKARLQERIAELEKMLNAKPEFMLADGAMLEAGAYRVIDGKLYKIVADAPPGIRDGTW